MDIEKFFEVLGERKEEIIRKAMQFRSAEELLPLAKEHEVALDQNQEAELLETMKKMSDDELEKATGEADV
ncbi:MAG TPA: hypothetical protein GXX49_10895 [Clostridiaceae bacterium]|nr:hypothetical protein [Clostridiaceae bacterium]